MKTNREQKVNRERKTFNVGSVAGSARLLCNGLLGEVKVYRYFANLGKGILHVDHFHKELWEFGGSAMAHSTPKGQSHRDLTHGS